MRHYRCRCGNRKMWGSMPPSPCQGCPKCGTTMAHDPARCKTPEPHDWTTEETVGDGDTVRRTTRCRRCHERMDDSTDVVAEDEKVEP